MKSMFFDGAGRKSSRSLLDNLVVGGHLEWCAVACSPRHCDRLVCEYLEDSVL